MKVIGITGGVGAGKSALLEEFGKNEHGGKIGKKRYDEGDRAFDPRRKAVVQFHFLDQCVNEHRQE